MIDIVEIIYERIAQYYNTFIEAPLEMQVMLSMATIMASMVLRTVWKVILPVRWVAATSLRGIAKLVYKPSIKSNSLTSPKFEHHLSFNDKLAAVQNTNDFKKILKEYKNKTAILDLADLELCVDLGYDIGIPCSAKIMRPFTKEKKVKQNERYIRNRLYKKYNPIQKASSNSKEPYAFSGMISSDSLVSFDKGQYVSGCVPTPPPNRVMHGY